MPHSASAVRAVSTSRLALEPQEAGRAIPIAVTWVAADKAEGTDRVGDAEDGVDTEDLREQYAGAH